MMRTLTLGCGLLGLLLLGDARGAPAAERHRVESLEVTILSTMLTDSRGVGEWGFAALVEADGYRVLYDTGYRAETVLNNARELGVDLSSVADVVLSHNHGDHTGGLLTLRNAFRGANPRALSRLHVGSGLFDLRDFPPRVAEMGFLFPPMREVRAAYEASGAEVIEYDKPAELAPGVWLTGPVPRLHPEQNWSPGVKVRRGGTWVPDTVFEDSALLVDTRRGLVAITGCGHAGVVNILDYARTLLPAISGDSVHAVIGGLHLFAASDEILDWTAGELERLGVERVLGAHCTGIHATQHLAERLGLARERAAVGAVGAGLSLTEGLKPLRIAR